MRSVLLVMACMLMLGLPGCGNSSDAAKASGKSRLFDDQRDALEKAQKLSDTMNAADQARRTEEENQTR